MSVTYTTGVQGEDSGTMACQQLYNDEHIGYCDIHVYGKVALVNLSSHL